MRREQIKTKELVTGGSLRPLSHFASVSLHPQTTKTHLRLCPFPDILWPNLFKAEPLLRLQEIWMSGVFLITTLLKKKTPTMTSVLWQPFLPLLAPLSSFLTHFCSSFCFFYVIFLVERPWKGKAINTCTFKHCQKSERQESRFAV